MKTSEKAILMDGRELEFVVKDDPPAGGMKRTYFAPDKSYVIQFYHDQSTGRDPNRLARLEAIVGKFNPTLDSSTGDYWKGLFCWPTGIVCKPEFGIVAPVYPRNFIFSDGDLKDLEKNGNWFILQKARKRLSEADRGNLLNYLKICILLARSVSRMHLAGLAHSDLSSNNVLIDPATGQAIIIDIDSLVVRNIFPPDVIGTRGYIAPEVLATIHLPLADPKRRHPAPETDLHALAVLMYEYILLRHPLLGPKNHDPDPDIDDGLAFGKNALFVEHPSDTSNRPKDLEVPCGALGPHMSDLFQRAFVKGLHSPGDRPSAMEWEKALLNTWDLLYPCANGSCQHKWFVVYDPARLRCPFCGTKPKTPIPMLKFRSERRPGLWIPSGELVVYNGLRIYNWHVFDNIFPGPTADKTQQGYCVYHEGRWLLVNERLPRMTSPAGNPVPTGRPVELKHGAKFRLSLDGHGREAEVVMMNP